MQISQKVLNYDSNAAPVPLSQSKSPKHTSQGQTQTSKVKSLTYLLPKPQPSLLGIKKPNQVVRASIPKQAFLNAQSGIKPTDKKMTKPT